MVQNKGRKTLYIALGVIVAAILAVGVVVFIASLSNKPTSDTNQTTTKDEPSVPEETQETTDKPTADVPEDDTDQASIDPEQVSTVSIEPMTIVVSYMKGVGGFDFQVSRNANGTQYVQFSNAELAGTKCTNDEGVFASIIESPTSDETATLTKTTTVDGTTYGLSLAESTCTSNAELLKQYQNAFSEPFSLLKKM
ncbi:MAG: hypothetical protein V4611_00075 [Patescibacteria group bacterium]